MDEEVREYETGYSVSHCSHYAIPIGQEGIFDIWECRECRKILKIKPKKKRKLIMPEIQEYKGNKLICLNPDAKFTFSFGVQKAKMIVEHFEAIKIFADTNGEICGQDEGEEAKYLRGNKR